MKYPNGLEIQIRDRVKLNTGDLGVVAFSVDADEFSEEFKKEEWSYLQEGVMVKTDEGVLIYYTSANVGDVLPSTNE